MPSPSSHLPYQPRCQWKAPVPSEASIYELLDEDSFRLLSLDGYSSQGALRCSLRSTNHETAGDYTAISYTWNEAASIWYGNYNASPKPIWINGKLVQVSDKVGNILCLARQHGKKCIWIDAICIDQANTAEKSRQVFRMGKVYGGATDVLCFLNNPDAETDKAFDAIKFHLYDKAERYPLDHVGRFYGLFKDEYWIRAWTLQETALAKTAFVCCGSKLALMDDLDRFQDIIDALPDWTWRTTPLIAKAGFQMLPFFIRMTRDGTDTGAICASRAIPRDEGFLEVLHRCRPSSSCSDARDLLYSRLALSPESSILIPYPDYTISVEELYKRFATNCILLTGSLEVITFATYTAMQLPSWVPDWASRSQSWRFEDDGYPEMIDAMKALSWNDNGLPKISQCRTELMVQGRILHVFRKGQSRGDDAANAIASQIFKRTAFRDAHVASENPKPGDLVCVLRNCIAFVHLRPCHDYHRIVARNSFLQGGYNHDELASRSRDARQALTNAESLPETTFRVR